MEWVDPIVTRLPEIAPMQAPNSMAPAMPNGSGMPRLVRISPAITAVSVIIVPTERSIPAEMITNITATPSTPLTAVACMMLTMP